MKKNALVNSKSSLFCLEFRSVTVTVCSALNVCCVANYKFDYKILHHCAYYTPSINRLFDLYFFYICEHIKQVCV